MAEGNTDFDLLHLYLALLLEVTNGISQKKICGIIKLRSLGYFVVICMMLCLAVLMEFQLLTD